MTEPDRPTDRIHDGPLMELHDQLVAAVPRATAPASPRWSNTVRYLAAAAALLVVVGTITIVSLVAGDDTPVAADVTVQKEGALVTVSIEDDVSVAELERALKDAGVDVTVTGSPTGPSLVNRFVGIIGPPGAILTGGDGSSSLRATFRPGSKVELQLGVVAKPGQPYDASPDATRAGEPLEGLTLEGKRFGDVRAQIEQRAAERGVTLDYRGATGQPADPPMDGTVEGAISTADDRVLVLVS